MWVFGQVWLLCLLAFVIGAGLDHLLFARPLRKQVRQLEIQLAKAKRAEAAPPPPAPAELDAERTGIVDEHPPAGSSWDPDRLPSWEREPVAESPRTLIAPTPEHDLGYDRPEPRYEAEPASQPLEPAKPFEPAQSFEAAQSVEPTRSFEPVEHDYHAEHEAEAPEPEPTRTAEPEPEPATTKAQAPEPPQPPADDRPTQVQAPIPAPPPIPNPSPAEMTAVITRVAGEANATETTSILPAARDDHEDMELADHGPVGAPTHGQLTHAPTDDLDDEHLVDDVVEEELTESEREAAAETTGPVARSVVTAAEKAVQERRLAGELADHEEPEQPSRHSLVEEPDAQSYPSHRPEPEPAAESYAPEPPARRSQPERAAQSYPPEPPARQAEPAAQSYPSRRPEPEPTPQPFTPIEAFESPAPEPEPESAQVQLEELSQPIRLDPNQFGKPIPPGALTPPGSVTPSEPAESSTPLPTRPQPAARPEPAPMEAVARPRSLFEPVLDPDGEDPYEDLDGFQPIQEPTIRSFSSTDSVPFTPILAPELLANEQPAPPASIPAGLPKRTVSSSWPRGGNGLGAGPQPFDPAPFRPRAQFSAMPRNTDAAPIRRPSSGGPRTPFGPGSALPKPDGSAPSDDYQVKAMIGSRTYHAAGSGSFNTVRAEVWFRNTEEAERAGFSAAD